MGSHLELRLKKLSLFALNRETSLPIARMPFYAEVGVRSTLQPPAIPPDNRFNDALRGALHATDEECVESQQCWNLVAQVLSEIISRLLTAQVRNELAVDNDSAMEFFDRVIRRAREAQAGGTLLGLDTAVLKPLLEDALRAEAEGRELGMMAPPPLPVIAWAHPLGILATDHKGYLSFDLKCLPDDIEQELKKAISARVLDPKAILDTTIWVYPMAREELRYDALAQGRFAHDAVLLKLALSAPDLPAFVKNSGLLSMQDPDLTDWRFSPGSFATNPSTLIGADGCESLLPANNALHEFNFHQVIGIPAAEVRLPIDASAAGKVRPAFINEYRLSFVPIGHSLGQILYSFPLAPGESVNFAVIDWTRRDSAMRNEDTKLDESLVHELRRDRIITETVRASIDEWQRGGSLMGGQATSVGGALGGSGMGIAAGASNAIGGAYSTSSGSRDIAADTVQKLSDNVAQAATSSRELHSTVVVQSAQAEHEAIETRTVVNYNHSHALTILYYEVLRHFRVVTEFVRRRPALLTNIHGGIAYVVTTPPPARHEVYWPAIYENRKVLEAALLDERYKEGFNIVERWRGPPPPPTPAPVPPPPVGPEFRYFEIEMKTGGWFADNRAKDVSVNATLFPINIRLQGGGGGGEDAGRVSPPGAFTTADTNNSFVAHLPTGIKVHWGEIDMIQLLIHQSETDVSFQHIAVTAIDVDGNRHPLVDKGYESGHLTLTNDFNIDLPTRRPPPLAGRSAAEIGEEAKFKEFNEHLLNRRPHYERALRLGMTPAMRAFELASLGVGDGATLLEKVDNRPLEVLGDFVAYPCVDPAWSKLIMAAIESLELPKIEHVERLITLPSRGVFAEAKLGHCNASEEIDNTRFWDWQQSPIPHMAPEIAPVQPVTPQVVTAPGLTPTQFPASLVNIVNPPSAPDPQGMTAALTALATANIFRDMSGRAEVADLLKKLSDNSVAIAGVAQNAATAGAGGGKVGGSGGSGSSPTGVGSSLPSLGGPRATPTQPSAVNRDLQDRMNVLGQAVDKGYLTPQQAQEALQRSVDEASGSVQQVGEKYMRPAFTNQELAAIVGEAIAEDALRARGLIVFSNWRKHVSATGFDMAAYEPPPPVVAPGLTDEGTLWLVDNKAQFRGIGDANALTGDAFEAYKTELRTFLGEGPHGPRTQYQRGRLWYQKTWPNKAEADLALKALNANKVKLVVTNGFAGDATRFTKGLFEKGLHAFDVRLGKLYAPGTYAEWELGYKALSVKKGARVAGTRGAVCVEAMLLVVATVGGAAFLIKAGPGFRSFVGEVAANIAFELALSWLPGGFFASVVVGMESDETPAQRAGRKLNEQVDLVLSLLPDVNALSPADLQTTRDNLKAMIQNPLMLETSFESAAPSGIHLPGLDWQPHSDWT